MKSKSEYYWMSAAGNKYSADHLRGRIGVCIIEQHPSIRYIAERKTGNIVWRPDFSDRNLFKV